MCVLKVIGWSRGSEALSPKRYTACRSRKGTFARNTRMFTSGKDQRDDPRKESFQVQGRVYKSFCRPKANFTLLSRKKESIILKFYKNTKGERRECWASGFVESRVDQVVAPLNHRWLSPGQDRVSRIRFGDNLRISQSGVTPNIV